MILRLPEVQINLETDQISQWRESLSKTTKHSWYYHWLRKYLFRHALFFYHFTKPLLLRDRTRDQLRLLLKTLSQHVLWLQSIVPRVALSCGILQAQTRFSKASQGAEVQSSGHCDKSKCQQPFRVCMPLCGTRAKLDTSTFPEQHKKKRHKCYTRLETAEEIFHSD